MSAGVVILAGGKSSRMRGANKALLPWNGISFLERLLREFQDFDECLVSVDSADRYPQLSAALVVDRFSEVGPIGGIYSALAVCRSDALMVTACDTPLVSRELVGFLLSHLSFEWDAVMAEDRRGRVHPLCGVYQRSAAPLLLEQIRGCDYKMANLLNRLRVRQVKLPGTPFSDDCLLNINRPQDYQTLLRRFRQAGGDCRQQSENAEKATLIGQQILH